MIEMKDLSEASNKMPNRMPNRMPTTGNPNPVGTKGKTFKKGQARDENIVQSIDKIWKSDKMVAKMISELKRSDISSLRKPDEIFIKIKGMEAWVKKYAKALRSMNKAMILYPYVNGLFDEMNNIIGEFYEQEDKFESELEDWKFEKAQKSIDKIYEQLEKHEIYLKA